MPDSISDNELDRIAERVAAGESLDAETAAALLAEVRRLRTLLDAQVEAIGKIVHTAGAMGATLTKMVMVGMNMTQESEKRIREMIAADGKTLVVPSRN